MHSSKKHLKILITGANSRLGTRIEELALAQKVTVLCTDLIPRNPRTQFADITKENEIAKLLKKEKPDCVIHTAALTDVDLCEREKELAWQVNVTGSENVAGACLAVGAKLINISTDYVFDGKSGPYSESDSPHPINVYGKTKLEAEKKVHALCKNSLTIRTCVPYDWNSKADPNFLMWLVQKLESKSKVKIVTDQFNTPTFAPHLAEIILQFCQTDHQGIVNVSGNEYLNRYEFALKVCKIFDCDIHLIQQCTTDEIKQIASRPRQAGLKVEKVENLLQSHMLPIEEGLKRAKQLRFLSL